jgi:hypothetical protein
MFKIVLSVIVIILFILSVMMGCSTTDTNLTTTVNASSTRTINTNPTTTTSPATPSFTPIVWSSTPVPTTELTEANANDWSVGASDQKITTVQNDYNLLKVGQSSIKLDTESGFDVYLRYQLNYGKYWDLSNIQYINFWIYTENPSDVGFQNASPWIQLQTSKGNFLQYQPNDDMLNSSREKWQEYKIPLGSDDTWNLYPVGSPFLTAITAIEIHADTWGYGFAMWLDGLILEPYPPNAPTVSPTLATFFGKPTSLILGPKISSLIVLNNPVCAGKSTALVCHVSDLDDPSESLRYAWSATNGVIQGSGYQVSFVGSTPGTAIIDVTVTNTFGSQDTAQLSVPVVDQNTIPTVSYNANVVDSIVYPMVIPVLVVKYFPVFSGRLNVAETGDVSMPLDQARTKTDKLTRGIITAMEEGSRYHSYNDTSAQPSLKYQVVETVEYLEPMPTWNKPGRQGPLTDYNQIMVRINAQEWVMNKGVKEIWLWGNVRPDTGGWESNMSSPYGDISNSDRDPCDLPIFDKTYTVYHYNCGREVSEAIEDHMHQNESIFGSLDNDLFWNKFVGKVGESRCGCTHFPPNGVQDYDWQNPSYIWTDIEDWKPDGSGQKVYINSDRWNRDSLQWFIYWMQSYPGMNNMIYDGAKKVSNWWIFIGEYDKCKAAGISLTN